MNVRHLLTVAIVLTFQYCTAQQAKQYTAQYCGSVVLRDVAGKYSVNVHSIEMPEVEGAAGQDNLNKTKAISARRFPYVKSPAYKKTTTALDPIVGINFVADTLPGIPPDNYMAINKNNIAVSVINQTIAIHNATTGTYLYRKSLSYFSNAAGLTTTNDFKYDPKIVYDPEADKFICVMLNGTNQYNYMVVAFSETNDPSGTWHFYKFYGDYTHDTSWFDYPAISITHNEFFLTGNKIMYDSSWQAGFRKTLIYQVRKADGYSGAAALNYQVWDSVTYNGKYLRCLYPVNPGDQVQGPAQYLLSNRNFDVLNDTVFLVKVPDTIGGSSTLTVTPLVSSLSYGVPPDGRQPDTNYTLATNDGRILGGFIKGDEIQFVNTSVNPVNGSASVYHGVISNVSTAPSLTGHIFSIDTLDFGYPNISFTGLSGGAAQSIITFDYTGPTTFPGFGAIFFDGSNFSNLVKVKTGIGRISQLSQKQQRWGDYSGSQPDWGIIGSVWAEGIFSYTYNNYGSYMAQLYSPYFTGVKEVAVKPAVKLFPNPASEFVHFEFSLVATQSVDFAIYDMQGRLVDKLTTQLCKAGDNMIEIDIAPLATGTYFIKGLGAAGEVVETGKFTKK